MSELKPCPCCGCNALWNPKETTRANGPVTYNLNLGYIECVMSCVRTSGLLDKEIATNIWNRRRSKNEPE